MKFQSEIILNNFKKNINYIFFVKADTIFIVVNLTILKFIIIIK